MWVLFGIGAIIFALLNIVYAFKNKTMKWFGFISLSLTIFTMCAFYSDGAKRVVVEDWSGLMDTMPTMSTALWICCVISVLINLIPLAKDKVR